MKLRLLSPSGVRVADGEATGTIENTDLMPAALLARFGRATAEQVVGHIEERMAAPRLPGAVRGSGVAAGQRAGLRARLLDAVRAADGNGSGGRGPDGRRGDGWRGPDGDRLARGRPPGRCGTTGTGAMGGLTGAMGTAGQHAPMAGAVTTAGYGPGGGGLFGSMGMGGDLFSNSEFELNRESRGGILSFWSRSSRSHFSGIEDALSLDGDVRTTMFGADYARGPLTLGLSVGRTLGLGGYNGPSGGRMSTSMTGFYPWVGYQVSDRVSVWGGDRLRHRRAEPDAGRRVGARDGRVDGDVGGGDAGRADRLAGHGRVRAGVQGRRAVGRRGQRSGRRRGGQAERPSRRGDARSHAAGGLAGLHAGRPVVADLRLLEVGLRRDGGDAETGAGMDVGGGLAFTDTVTGLSLDVWVRTLVVHQAEQFTERGMSLSLGWDPTPSSALGLTAKVAASWGGEARGGAEALWGNQMAYGMGSHQMYGSDDRVDAEVGSGCRRAPASWGRRASA